MVGRNIARVSAQPVRQMAILVEVADLFAPPTDMLVPTLLDDLLGMFPSHGSPIRKRVGDASAER